MLQIRNLRVERGGQTICELPELRVEGGERVCVVGPNGSGKTTLLRVVGGLDREFHGECRADVPFRDRVYLHQSPYLFRGSVLANVLFGSAARKIARPQRISAARAWLDRLGVGHLIDRRCGHLSGGEQRRVALARAFATGADLLLLDEPFADLDQAGIDCVCAAIAALSHATLLISSPGPLPEAFESRVLYLDRPQ